MTFEALSSRSVALSANQIDILFDFRCSEHL